MAMVAARILEPQSKLATSLWWHTRNEVDPILWTKMGG